MKASSARKEIQQTTKALFSGPVFIIAEAGVNHNGGVQDAKRLIEAAYESGADAVKFQTFRADDLAGATAEKSSYQEQTTDKNESLRRMLQKLELSEAAHYELWEHCRKVGILFLSTPFDNNSVTLLDRLGVSLFKISSGDITNVPLLERVAATNKPIILSSGRSTLEEVGEAVMALRRVGCTDPALLHCVSNYPAPYSELNLRAMETMRGAFGTVVGYSDHSPGIEAPIAAVSLGARIIEKHLTLNRFAPGPDHHASLEPTQFTAMVRAIRHIESALGDGEKKPAPCELEGRQRVRRGLTARAAIPQGVSLTEEMVAVLRPADGIPPKHLSGVLGRKTLSEIPLGTPIKWNMLEASP